MGSCDRGIHGPGFEGAEGVATVDPDLALQDVQPLTDIVNDSWPERFEAIFVGGGSPRCCWRAEAFSPCSQYLGRRPERGELRRRIALGATPASTAVQALRARHGRFPLVGLVIGVDCPWSSRDCAIVVVRISPQEPRVVVGRQCSPSSCR
jgi:hypothetical protein